MTLMHQQRSHERECIWRFRCLFTVVIARLLEDGWKKKKKEEEEEEQRGEREERRKRSAVNNIQWHGTMAIPCGRLFRGRLNEAD